jgi:hypothetical protein
MSRSRLENKAWELFSRCVRLGYADGWGFCRCFTCGCAKHWKEIDAGHWIGRGKKPTKFNINNVRPQCKQCNKWGHPKLSRIRGEPIVFENHLISDGVDTEKLIRQSNGSGYRSLAELEDFVEELKDILVLTVDSAIKRGVLDARDALK